MSNNAIIKSMDDAERAARALVGSGFFADTKQASQAIVKIMAGQELGFGPFASMTGVHIIQNKPTLAANLMAAAVKRDGKYNYRVTKLSETECEIEFYERSLDGSKFEKVGLSAFTMADAKKAGLELKDNWKKYARNMLFARALSNGQKWYAPDVFGGTTVYTPDEMGAVTDEEGNIIDAQAKDVNTLQIAATAMEYDQAKKILVKVKGGEKLMGELTKEQLDYVVEKGKDSSHVEAAKIILENDFQMTAA